MEEISVFDVIGPNMIGPSSSHTAGALKIARMAYRIMGEKIVKVRFTLFGSFACTYSGHGTDRALVAGILGFDTEDGRIRDAMHYADEQGLEVVFETNTTDQDVHPNTVEMALTGENGKHLTVRGVSLGGGKVAIKQLDGVDVHIEGSGSTLIVRHIDKPGALAYIATCISQWNINIAGLRMHREGRGETAYAELSIDSPAPDSLIQVLEAHPIVTGVTQIQV